MVHTFRQIVIGKYDGWAWGIDWETGTSRGSLRLDIGGAIVWGGGATAAGVNDPG